MPTIKNTPQSVPSATKIMASAAQKKSSSNKKMNKNMSPNEFGFAERAMPDFMVAETVSEMTNVIKEAPLNPRTDSAGVAASALASNLLVLSDGRAGHENQSIGVAMALGIKKPEIITLKPVIKQGWLQWLPINMLYGRSLEELHERLVKEAGTLNVVIGTGWKISRASRWLKEQQQKKGLRLFTVQMMRASGRPSDYDVVALPRHSLKGKRWSDGASNMVLTVGAPNKITEDLLKLEQDRWNGRLQHCAEPRLAVLVGGDSKHGHYTLDDAKTLMRTVLSWANATGGSLLVTTSRRTSAVVSSYIARSLESQHTVPFYFWQPNDISQRDNPYIAYLANADAVVATPDSVAMVSEAATAGKPVYLSVQPSSMPAKFQTFYHLLMKQERLAIWTGKFTLRKPREGLTDSDTVAAFVRARIEVLTERGLAK